MDDMLARHSADWLHEWLAYFELEPFGPAREDLRAGVTAAAVANFAGMGRKRGAPVVKPTDFFENLRPPRKPQTGNELAMNAKNLTRAFGGYVLKKGEKPPKAAPAKVPKKVPGTGGTGGKGGKGGGKGAKQGKANRNRR